MSQQPARSSSSSSNSSRALVSARQSSTSLKFLSKAGRTKELSELQKYLDRKGDANVLVYYVQNEIAWYAEEADYLGADKLLSAPLLTLCCSEHLIAHVLALLDAGADVNGGGHECTPLFSASANNHTEIIQLLLSHGLWWTLTAGLAEH